MNTQKALAVLCWLIVAGALVAAGTSVLSAVLWVPGGEHFAFTTLRGETVQIQGGGLYRFDSVSVAAQGIAQDVVTLVLGIPLLIVAGVWARRGSLRGQVLRAGTLGYFLYSYTAIAMTSAYNELFLLYVALFGMSVFAFVLAVTAIDIAGLPARVSDRFPRRTIAGFALFLGVMLLLLWLGRIVPALLAGTPPFGLESYTTLVIQVLDLGLIVPTAILTGVLLLRRAPFGYLLAAVVLAFGLSMGAAVSAMVAGQLLAGVETAAAEIVFFPALMLANLVLGGLLLRSLRDGPAANPADAERAALVPAARRG